MDLQNVQTQWILRTSGHASAAYTFRKLLFSGHQLSRIETSFAYIGVQFCKTAADVKWLKSIEDYLQLSYILSIIIYCINNKI